MTHKHLCLQCDAVIAEGDFDCEGEDTDHDWALCDACAKEREGMKMALTVGRFTLDNKRISGPREYMKERGNRIIEDFNAGGDTLIDMYAQYSPNPATALLVRLQTDYAGWRGTRELEFEGGRKMEECIYCNALVPEVDVPDLADDEAWTEIAQLHAPDCEWVLTRAHRL